MHCNGCHDDNYMATFVITAAAIVMTTVAWQQTQILMHMPRASFIDQYDWPNLSDYIAMHLRSTMQELVFTYNYENLAHMGWSHSTCAFGSKNFLQCTCTWIWTNGQSQNLV